MSIYQVILQLLVLGLIPALPGIYAFSSTASVTPAWRRLYRTGPVLLIPPMIAFATISHMTCEHESACVRDQWRSIGFYLLAAIALGWIALLIARERDEPVNYTIYAFVFGPLFWLYASFAHVVAIKFPL